MMVVHMACALSCGGLTPSKNTKQVSLLVFIETWTVNMYFFHLVNFFRQFDKISQFKRCLNYISYILTFWPK